MNVDTPPMNGFEARENKTKNRDIIIESWTVLYRSVHLVCSGIAQQKITKTDA